MNIFKHLTLSSKISSLVILLLCALLFIAVNLVLNSRAVVENVVLESEIRQFYSNTNNKWKEILKAHEVSEDLGMKFSSRSIEKNQLEEATNNVEMLMQDYVASLLLTSIQFEKEWNSTLSLNQEQGIFYFRDQLLDRVEILNKALLALNKVWLTQATFVHRKKAEKVARHAFPAVIDSIEQLNLMHDQLVEIRTDSIIDEQNKVVIQSTILAISIFAVGIILSLLILRKLKKDLQSIVVVSHSLAKGDLSRTLEVGDNRDEISEIKRSISSMTGNLNHG